jgi:short-subunit dehydrogenase
MPETSPQYPPATPLQPRRRALLIGASSGIGAALAHRLASEGWLLALVARRQELLTGLCNEINQKSGENRAAAYVHDVTDYVSIPALLRQITSDMGGLDLVIYNAGVNYPPGQTLEAESDRKMVEINLIGAMAWLDPVANLFQTMKGGQIVGISSVAGDRGRVANPGYNASKAGLTCYLEGLRNRLTRHGVHVLTVRPGFVQTDMLAAAQKVMFPVPAGKAAAQICRAIKTRRQDIYVPGFWRMIMLAIIHVPSIIFRRLSI